MEIFQIFLLIGVFFVMALMMFFRKIPALIALPLMAFLIALIGRIKFSDIIEFVIGQGSLKLHVAYTIALFGSMLSVLMQKTGVAEAFIKKGAELSGDNPWLIAIILLFINYCSFYNTWRTWCNNYGSNNSASYYVLCRYWPVDFCWNFSVWIKHWRNT